MKAIPITPNTIPIPQSNANMPIHSATPGIASLKNPMPTANANKPIPMAIIAKAPFKYFFGGSSQTSNKGRNFEPVQANLGNKFTTGWSSRTRVSLTKNVLVHIVEVSHHAADPVANLLPLFVDRDYNVAVLRLDCSSIAGTSFL